MPDRIGLMRRNLGLLLDYTDPVAGKLLVQAHCRCQAKYSAPDYRHIVDFVRQVVLLY